MAKHLSLDDALAHLRALRARPVSELSQANLVPLLASSHSAVVSPAAALAADGGMTSVIPTLVAAFERFSTRGEKTDKGCLAKLAIANALCTLDHREPEIYLRGVRTHQIEPAFGRSIDTAGELRGRCAEALVACLYPHALVEIAPLLADPDPQARVGAVRAAGLVPGEAGAALLRLKLAAGDPEAVVLGECCAGLLSLDPGLHAGYVAGFLDPPTSEIAQVAVAALAESRSPEALTVLRQTYESAGSSEARKVALEALGRLRVDGAAEFLLTLVRNALHPRAREVIEALGPRKSDERFMARLRATLTERDDRMLERHAEEVLRDPGA